MYRQGMASSSIGEHNKKIFYSTRDSTTGTTRITHSSIIGKGKSWDISVQITKETSEIWISTTSVITTHNHFIQNRWFSANHKPPSYHLDNDDMTLFEYPISRLAAKQKQLVLSKIRLALD